MNKTIAGVEIADGVMARAATEQIRGTESESMYHYAFRSYLFGALTGYREQLTFDAEMLYIGALFHNARLDARHQSSPYRFEIDGANAAREFLWAYPVNERDIDAVSEAVALHMTPAIPKSRPPMVALLSAGVQMDLRGALRRVHRATARRGCAGLSARTGFQEKDQRSLCARAGALAGDYLRNGLCRRSRSMGPELPATEFLWTSAWIGLAELTCTRLLKGH
ncbi:hypothetical protein BSU04_37175 [Caballeronia sordidicola]|jgi:hypothetical protein|uniref:HD domain-containing protein n=1 Tax=Caballeronia sordidicola TaxID=196367 RepID=A0A226WRF6_CABSO|nr:hypothetical protein BSU04_37175 [Caballeronia sordidicola]